MKRIDEEGGNTMKEEEWVEGKERGEDNWRIDGIPSKISMKSPEGDRMVRRWEEIRVCERGEYRVIFDL